MHSPPLTPAASKSQEGVADAPLKVDATKRKVPAEGRDGSQATSPAMSPTFVNSSGSSPVSRRGSSGQLSTRPTTSSADHVAGDTKSHRAVFGVGSSSHSSPTSRDASPSRS